MAAKEAQELIITNEDPYDDDPLMIIEEIAQGAREAGAEEAHLKCIPDRREAIRVALMEAKKGDLVLLTGKGSEQAIMGPNGSGKSTLSSVLAGKEDYEVTDGEILFEGENIIEDAPEERAHKGIFLSFQYPVEIPGVSVTNFIKAALNETRKANGKEELSAKDMLALVRQNSELLGIKKDFLGRSLNEGFSGGEKKRNEIFQMMMLNPKLAILDETDSGLDIDALRIVSDGINRLTAPTRGILFIVGIYFY
jgi:Fe-S cluster assembly ATP-binding protein